jgi:hypothetical protein
MDKKIFALLVFVLITFTFVQYSFCQEVVVDTVVNQQSKILLTPINAGGNDASLRDIQKSAGYKVEIISGNPKLLKVEISGPVVFKEISDGVGEITLKLLNSEAEFDNWIKSKDAPYKVSFTITAKDVRDLYTVSETGTFTFGKW